MDLEKTIKDSIVKTVLERKKPEKIVIFGSRADDTAKEPSDIDIAIFGKDWSDTDINIAKSDLDEKIATPLKFDVLNYYALSKEALKRNIIEKGEVIYECAKDK